MIGEDEILAEQEAERDFFIAESHEHEDLTFVHPDPLIEERSPLLGQHIRRNSRDHFSAEHSEDEVEREWEGVHWTKRPSVCRLLGAIEGYKGHSS